MNDDLISRQAVIDIINFEDKWLLDAKGHNADTEIAFSGMKSRIAKLPPVTPQKPMNRDCVSRDYLLSLANKDGAYGYVSAHEIINAPSINPQEPRWIPVSERLPEEDDFYLVTAKVGNELIIDISEYTPKNDFWDIPHEIVAWLPLPKPYKAESEEV